MNNFNDNTDWAEILEKLAEIRKGEDYSIANVEFIRDQLLSTDERIRGGAALASEGCIFEPEILDILIEITESDPVDAIRKATIQSLGKVIYEGVMQSFENETGSTTDIEFYEEWDEIQSQSLQEDYLRVKNLLFSIVQDEFEDLTVRESALKAISDLGFLNSVKEWIKDFLVLENQSSQLAALHTMGKYPYYWLNELSRYLTPETPKSLLMEAISSSYSSESSDLADKIEKLLELEDPDIISYALLTLANINKTENLGEILQKFVLYQDNRVQEAAKEAMSNYTKLNFRDYMKDTLGLEED
jgi:HEAT repeat protein